MPGERTERDEEYLKFRSFLASQKNAPEEAKEAPALSPCEELRKQGNDLFNLGIFENAVIAYSEALKFAETDDDRGKLYSNRSAAYLKCEEEDHRLESVDDARQTVRLLPEWPKGYLRLASGLMALGQYELSINVIEKGSKLGMSGGARMLREARKGIFDGRVRDKVFLQRLKGLDVEWRFAPPQTLHLKLMDHSIEGQYFLQSEKVLHVSSQEDGKNSQDYEFEFRGEEFWIKSKKDPDFVQLLVIEDTVADELPFKDEDEYLNAWLQMLPPPEEGALTVAVKTDSEEVTQKKTLDRMCLVQELSKIQKRGQDLHLPAMESIRNRKNKMCKELHRRMVAMGLMEPERIEVVDTVEKEILESPTRCCSTGSSGKPAMESNEMSDVAEEGDGSRENGHEKAVFFEPLDGETPLAPQKSLSQVDTTHTDEAFFGEADDECDDKGEEEGNGDDDEISDINELTPRELAQVQADSELQHTPMPCSGYGHGDITTPSVLPPEALELHRHVMEKMEREKMSQGPLSSVKGSACSNKGYENDEHDVVTRGGGLASRPIKSGLRNSLAQCFQGFAKMCGRQ